MLPRAHAPHFLPPVTLLHLALQLQMSAHTRLQLQSAPRFRWACMGTGTLVAGRSEALVLCQRCSLQPPARDFVGCKEHSRHQSGTCSGQQATGDGMWRQLRR